MRKITLKDVQDIPRRLVGKLWYALGRLLQRWANDDIGHRR